jgi:hypothetical protein
MRNLLAYLSATIFVVLMLLVGAQAQTTIGGVQNVTGTSCPAGFDTNMTCFTAKLVCQNTVGLDFTFGYETPPSGTVNGTIVLLPGAGGQNANQEQEKTFAHYYYGTANYQVVQLKWGNVSNPYDWEDATNGGTPGYSPNIEVAACRPATFLKYIYTNYYQLLPHTTLKPGMCAQGFSAGSGAIGYALAFYGMYQYLDKVELLSGPVFSDIKQGCVVPQASAQTICQGSPSWCQLGTQSPWTDSPTYSGAPLGSIRTWTGDTSCYNGSTTSSTSNSNWLAMSIVNQSSSSPPPVPVFSYPHTSVTGFLCASTQTGVSPNNSSAEGWIFHEAVAGTLYPPTLYAVQNCPTAEGVYGTNPTTGQSATVPALSSEDGFTAIENDMSSITSPTGVCKGNH